ncbi:MAG: hypothetical protein WC980_06440 [Candidatus Brocadiia bacterium]
MSEKDGRYACSQVILLRSCLYLRQIMINIVYSNIVIKQLLENWVSSRGESADELVALHMEEKFKVHEVLVTDVKDQNDFLLIKISSMQWGFPKEFILTRGGTLAWKGDPKTTT